MLILGSSCSFVLQYYIIASISKFGLCRRIVQVVLISRTAILYYDHFATFSLEVDRIWRRKLNVVSWLFILNRYAAFLGYFTVLYFTFGAPNDIKVRCPARLSEFLQKLFYRRTFRPSQSVPL